MNAKTFLALATLLLLFASYRIGLIVVPLIIMCGYFLGGESGAKDAELRDYLTGFQNGKEEVYAEWERYQSDQKHKGVPS